MLNSQYSFSSVNICIFRNQCYYYECFASFVHWSNVVIPRFVSGKKLGDKMGNEEQLVEMMPKGPSHNADVEGATQERTRISTAALEKGDVNSASENQPDASVPLRLKDGDASGSSKRDEANGGLQASTRRGACLDYVKNTDVYKILA